MVGDLLDEFGHVAGGALGVGRFAGEPLLEARDEPAELGSLLHEDDLVSGLGRLEGRHGIGPFLGGLLQRLQFHPAAASGSKSAGR